MIMFFVQQFNSFYWIELKIIIANDKIPQNHCLIELMFKFKIELRFRKTFQQAFFYQGT